MLLDKLISYLVPFDCIGCNAEGSLLCADCSAALPAVPERCYRCHRASVDSRTCIDCRDTSPLYAAYARTVYGGTAKDLIWKLKSQGAQAAAGEMAELIAPTVRATGDLVLVSAPTATSRARQRGYDQAQLLARALSRELRIPCATALRRLGQHHQVGASRKQRLTQLQDAYRCVQPSRIAGKHVLLVDDVLTTGATVESAARVLKAAGATQVSAITFAQA